MTDISVVIATYNRARKLEACLRAFLANAVGPDLTCEIVVVDNASTDDTAATVERVARGAVLPIRYLYEGRKGASAARNAGLATARGDIISIVDDDCYPDGRFLETLKRLFDGEPSLSMIGGRVELFDPTAAPVTIRTMTQRIPFEGPHQLFYLIPGCNMAFRRAVWQATEGYDVRLGPGSPKNLVSEDPDFVYRTHKAGFGICYIPDLLVRHDHGRRSDEDLTPLKRSYWLGRGGMYAKYALAGDTGMLRLAFWELAAEVRAALKSLARGRRPGESADALKHLMLGGWRFWRTRKAQ